MFDSRIDKTKVKEYDEETKKFYPRIKNEDHYALTDGDGRFLVHLTKPAKTDKIEADREESRQEEVEEVREETDDREETENEEGPQENIDPEEGESFQGEEEPQDTIDRKSVV